MACKPSADSSSAAPAANAPASSAKISTSPNLSAVAELGRRLFFDARLSASGRQSCASCHDPAHAYAPANAQAVQLGGPELDRPGTRAVPSLMYKEYTLPYADAYENPDRISTPGPGGGFTWDGRASSIAGQAELPLLAANEMANASKAEVAARLAAATYAADFRRLFGAEVFDDPDKAFVHGAEALEAFQREDPSFHPYSSKFDRHVNNKVGGAFTEAETRGLRVFVDEKKGNCFACHLLGTGNGGSHDMTSDYSFAAIGVPRNPEIAANADPAYFDLGLCGPLRRDHLPRDGRDPGHWCGKFKTPILRNVATRRAFMHNGRFHTLRETLAFYATRDTDPGRWYPKDAQGRVQKFDDLPRAYRASLDPQRPLDGRAAGSARSLSDQDLDDLEAFLRTLTDDPFSAP